MTFQPRSEQELDMLRRVATSHLLEHERAVNLDAVATALIEQYFRENLDKSRGMGHNISELIDAKERVHDTSRWVSQKKYQ